MMAYNVTTMAHILCRASVVLSSSLILLDDYGIYSSRRKKKVLEVWLAYMHPLKPECVHVCVYTCMRTELLTSASNCWSQQKVPCCSLMSYYKMRQNLNFPR